MRVPLFRARGSLLTSAILGVAACATNAAPAIEPGFEHDYVPEAAQAELIEVRPDSQVVPIFLDEWEVRPEAGPAQAGRVTFEVRNEGLIPHALSVFGTESAPDELRVVEGRAVVSASTLTASIPELAPGDQQQWTLLLPPGDYVLLCNLPAHYEAGMRTSFMIE